MKSQPGKECFIFFRSRLLLFHTFAAEFMVRYIATYLLAALVLFTNIGVPVFTHVCRGQGKTWSSVLLPARSCCRKITRPKVAGPCDTAGKCCAPGIKSSPCCENETTFLQIDTNMPRGIVEVLTVTSPTIVFLPSCMITSVSSDFSIHYSFQPHAPPGPVYGRTMLLLNQVFLC